jgi:predicted component of type VI protein secretion system
MELELHGLFTADPCGPNVGSHIHSIRGIDCGVRKMDAQFVMFKENGERKDFALRNQTTIVGRKDDCDIRIPLKEVSRQHAEIQITRHGVHVKDLGSSNGTYVNNERVQERELVPGDHLVIGPVVFTLQVDGEPADIKRVKTKLRRKASRGPTDELTAEVEEPNEAQDSKADASGFDSEVMAALEASGEGSGLDIDFEELDLGDSAVAEQKD